MSDTPDPRFAELPYQPPTPEQLAALKGEHGQVHELYNEHASIWIKRPRKAHFAAWKADMNNEQRAEVAGEALLRSVLVHPPMDKFNELLELFPAITGNLADQALHIIGASTAANHRKS